MQDIRYALRWLRRSPGFAAVAILSIGWGVGVNTAMFSLVDSLLFKPLPAVSAPHELARVKAGETQMAWANYEDIRRGNDVFVQFFAQRSFTSAASHG